MRRRELLLGTVALAAPLPRRARAHGDLLKPAQDFIDEMVAEHGFDRAKLEALFADLQMSQSALKLIAPPGSGGGDRPSWDEYRSRHVDPINIRHGISFVRRYRFELKQAEERFGLPVMIIAAIIGVETRYGRYTGKFRTIEALATLAFNYPRRAEYFRGELTQLLLYGRESGVDVSKLRGSYAGAFGYGQFMPTSARKWAVDMDGDGQADLFSFADAIGSVANFLADHGWQPGVEVSYEVRKGRDANPDKLLAAGILPSLTAEDFAAAGMDVRFPGGAIYDGKLALVDLVNDDYVVYRAGTINYYVLTRYNRSNNYAMSVLDLAREIEERGGV